MTNFAKRSILDVRQGYKYSSDFDPKNRKVRNGKALHKNP